MQYQFSDKIRVQRQEGILGDLFEHLPGAEAEQPGVPQVPWEGGSSGVLAAEDGGPGGQAGQNDRREHSVPGGNQPEIRQVKETPEKPNKKRGRAQR